MGKDKKYGKGSVSILFVINKDGSIPDAHIHYSSYKNAYLDKKVLEAVKRLRHQPAEYRGEKVRYLTGVIYFYTK